MFVNTHFYLIKKKVKISDTIVRHWDSSKSLYQNLNSMVCDVVIKGSASRLCNLLNKCVPCECEM